MSEPGRRKQKNKNNLKTDDIIEYLVQDPSNIPDVRCFAGFLGKSSKEKYWRRLGEMIAGED